jgi:hypothetical protein
LIPFHRGFINRNHILALPSPLLFPTFFDVMVLAFPLSLFVAAAAPSILTAPSLLATTAFAAISSLSVILATILPIATAFSVSVTAPCLFLLFSTRSLFFLLLYPLALFL